MSSRLCKALGAAVLAALMLGGCKATPPGRLETMVVTNAERRFLIGGKRAKNPLLPTAENLAAGKDSFSHYCIVCHGLDGQNTGVPFADQMSPPVPSLASKQVQAYTDGQLHWIVTNGIGPSGMPASKGILNDDEIWSTVLYIRHLPARGSLGEPATYSGDDCSPTSATKP